MKLCQKLTARLCLLFMAVFFMTKLPAYSQRVNLGFDAGETTDRFGGLPRATTPELGFDGQWLVRQGNHKEGMFDVVVGGEIRLPADTSAHAPEFAAYAGPMFWFGNHLSIGFHAQVRKVILPTSEINDVFFPRYKMLLLEVPAVIEYRFGHPGAVRHAFAQAQVAPEFSPHYTQPSSGGNTLPTPQLDHGYFARGSAGYSFGKWYAKATYETRFFKFSNELGNPNNLYNWRTDMVTGGIGVIF